ncbi:MAG: hypothetical protein N4J56_003788 [Chroococcidiopsis sp. SAG 2025]|uniref:sensor histidine kinase n=1 Tax=Chroococcidiopsis sp. SAG 2025 TaxID=171389 RepID=UPI00293726B0|nr:CHASE2 domain-containing protein [Chroococcidiopsis sp. SAG 2025]MDV2994134.1 hypothetical protein [Chroococcidiopsis sp. SAG 2025]
MSRRWKILNIWLLSGVGLSAVWSLVLSAVLSQLPLVGQLELRIQDNLIRLHKPSILPKEILLVTIDRPIARPEHNFYAELIRGLIDKGAKVVVLNLPNSIRRPLDSRLENSLKQAIAKFSDQIVLVTYIKKRSHPLPSVIPVYHHLLPFDRQSIKPLIAPEQVHGFFESEVGVKDLTSPARQAHLAGDFHYVEDFHQTHQVKSVAAIALEKFSSPLANPAIVQIIENENTPLTQIAVNINFWGPAGTFPRLKISSICAAAAPLKRCSVSPTHPVTRQVRHKLVLLDLPKEYLTSLGVLSPFGNRMSVGEVQANLIASLMTNSYLKTTPQWLNYIVNTLGAICLGLLITAGIVERPTKSIRAKIWLFGGILGGYTGLCLLAAWQGSLVPLATPIVIWLGSGALVAVCLQLAWKQHQLHQQRQALAERQAVLLQARKLLHRVVTDIHDGPLQELKLVMDGIELLAINHPTVNPNPLLDKLEAVGRELRAQLGNTRTIAEKLEITPELEAGLERGMRQHLQHLVQKGELTLSIQDNLQPLLEPQSDSRWIDAREDIFRFFKEAIANVICHAQPPNGSATEISISLTQKRSQCTLLVENNATRPAAATLESPNRRKSCGGYGTKLMATIAAELPGGHWERISQADGGMQVRLVWTLHATPRDKTKDE